MGWCFDADVFVAYGEEIEFEEIDAADLLFKMLLHKTEEQETMEIASISTRRSRSAGGGGGLTSSARGASRG